MEEISKRFNILIIIHIIIAGVYGFIYLVLPEMFSKLSDAPNFDPHIWRLWGGTLLVLVIFGILMIKRAAWEKIKIFWEFVIIWLIMIFLIDIVALFAIPRSAVNISSQLVDIILIGILIIVDIYFYIQEGQ